MSRDAILDYLKTTPGASTSMVAAQMGIDPSTADYHLRRLKREGKASPLPTGREVAWFARSCGLCPALKRVVPTLRRSSMEGTLRALEPTPLTARSLALRSGASEGEVRWAIEVLVAAGLAQKSKLGRAQLAEGADLCAQKALRAEACDLWGKCPVSRRLDAR